MFVTKMEKLYILFVWEDLYITLGYNFKTESI